MMPGKSKRLKIVDRRVIKNGFWDDFNFKQRYPNALRNCSAAIGLPGLLRGSLVFPLLVGSGINKRNIQYYSMGTTRDLCSTLSINPDNITFSKLVGFRALNIFTWPYIASFQMKGVLFKIVDEADIWVKRNLYGKNIDSKPNEQPSSLLATVIKGIVMAPFLVLELVAYPMAKLSNIIITAVFGNNEAKASNDIKKTKSEVATSVPETLKNAPEDDHLPLTPGKPNSLSQETGNINEQQQCTLPPSQLVTGISKVKDPNENNCDAVSKKEQGKILKAVNLASIPVSTKVFKNQLERMLSVSDAPKDPIPTPADKPASIPTPR